MAILLPVENSIRITSKPLLTYVARFLGSHDCRYFGRRFECGETVAEPGPISGEELYKLFVSLQSVITRSPTCSVNLQKRCASSAIYTSALQHVLIASQIAAA